MPTNAARIFIAEAIGTFTLIFVGFLAIYSNGLVQPPGTANLAAIGLAHGLAIGVSVAALGAISGGHFNPAATFGFVVTGRLKPAADLMYWVAQLLGASIAGFLALAVVGQAGVAIVQAPSLATATRGGPAPAEERGEPTIASG